MLGEDLLATRFFNMARSCVGIDRPEECTRHACSKESFHVNVVHKNIYIRGPENT